MGHINMPILFFVLGAAGVICLLKALHHFKKWRFLYNLNADYSAPGLIPCGNFERFTFGVEQLFAAAPAQSYISIYAYNPAFFHVEETKFFIRSAGKRDGQHSFRGELRLSEKDRHHIVDALPMLERIGAPIERQDKSYGLVVLKTSKLETASDLIEIAREFSKRVLNCGEDDPLTISWHVAGFNGAQNRNKRR